MPDAHPLPPAIGPYPVEKELGRGGMGVVYLARDRRLERPVAIKVLPHAFSQDSARLARFEREARSLAALNHPAVAAIYSIETHGGETVLVLEYVPGRTLTDQLRRGPMPLDDALQMCLEIAEGIEAAHERGVVHRDLKPDNVRITPDGAAKILDFGLAMSDSAGGAAGASEADTVLVVNETATTAMPGLTQYGVVMGTPGYMAPEQARGVTVDKRADIWAFGCILYQVLSGAKAFHGETVSDCIAAVIDKEPDYGLLPITTPARIRALIRKCLTKDPRRRLRDIGDARIELEEVLSDPAAAYADSAQSSSRPRAIARLSLRLPESAPLINAPRCALALSPDGASLAYIGATGAHDSALMLRNLEESEARAIQGTSGVNAEQPFYSPDGQKLAFFSGGRLRRVMLSGGVPMPLAPAPRPQGGSWDPTDHIYFVPDFQAGAMRIPASGTPATSGHITARLTAEPEVIVKSETAGGGAPLLSPEMLPGGKALLVALWTGATHDDAQIAAIDLRTNQVRPLVQGGANPRFASTGGGNGSVGHIVFTRRNSILAVAFDAERLEVFGQPQVVVEGVLANALGGGVQFAFNADGTLVYAPGPIFEPATTLTIAHRHGIPGAPEPHALIADRRAFTSPALSPDGSRLAVVVQGPTDHLWLIPLDRAGGGTPQRLTFSGDNAAPIWFPDNRRIAFSTKSGDHREIRVLNIDPSTAPAAAPPAADPSAGHVLVSSAHTIHPCCTTHDGLNLIYAQTRPQGGSELFCVKVGAAGASQPAAPASLLPSVEGAGSAWGASISPDDRFVAFVSDQTGRPEVFVSPLIHAPDGLKAAPQRWQVSREGGGGGAAPRWAPTGGELYFRTTATNASGAKMDTLVAVRIAIEPSFMVGRPRPMLESAPGRYVESTAHSANFEVFPDGDRILVMQRAAEPDPATELRIVINWFADLLRRVPLPKVSRTGAGSGAHSSTRSGFGLTGSAYPNSAHAPTTPGFGLGTPSGVPAHSAPPPARPKDRGFDSSAGTLM